MKYRLLNYLVCPECGRDLTLSVFKEAQGRTVLTKAVKKCTQRCAFRECKTVPPDKDAGCDLCMTCEIEAGILSCSCRKVYPIVEGIPRMLPDAFIESGDFTQTYKNLLNDDCTRTDSRNAADLEHSMVLQKKTRKSFGYQWLRYNVDDPLEDRAIFLYDSQLPEKALADKLVLDAGCGMGRYTAVTAGMGAEVIGMDLSRSILKAYEKTLCHPLAHIIQADITHPPFRKKQFDVIYSLGVLHHTPDPRQAFLELVACLKEEGIMSFWLYGSAGTFSDFKSNPLREDRKRFIKGDVAQRIHWLTVWLREALYRCVRRVTTRMNVPLLYCLSYPLAALGKIPLIRYLTPSVHPNWRVRLQENFDWFSPEYQSHHTKEEVQGWCAEATVEVVSLLKHGFIPKVGIKGVLRNRV